MRARRTWPFSVQQKCAALANRLWRRLRQSMRDSRTGGSFTSSTDPQCVNTWSTLSWNSNTCQKLTWRTACWKTSQFFRWDNFDKRDPGLNLISLRKCNPCGRRLNRIMANSMHLLNISDLQFLFQIVHDISPNVFSKYALCEWKMLVSRSRPGEIAPLCPGHWIEMSLFVAASKTQESWLFEKWTLYFIAGDHQQGHAGDPALHLLRVRGLHLRARRPAPHVQARQGVGGGVQRGRPPSHLEHHRDPAPGENNDAIIHHNNAPVSRAINTNIFANCKF